jgi:hypothetical protein
MNDKDSLWNNLYPLAARAAILLLAYSLFTIISLTAIGGMPEMAREGFDLLTDNRLVGLLRLDVPDFILPGLFLLFGMGLTPFALTFGLLTRPNWPWAEALTHWNGHHWASTGTLTPGILMLTGQLVQAILIGFSTGIQYVMVVNGLTLLGFALQPSVRKLYC